MSRVAVVGAGLAGLAAGVELQRAGCEVHLLERSRLLGGKATSFWVDGVEVDSGQHVHLACCTAYRDFAESLGMGGRLYLQERFEALVLRRGQPPARLRAGRLPAPLHLAASMARYRPLGWRAKTELVRALLAARRPAAPDETMAAWLRRQRQGADAVAGFWEPFLVPALNAPLDQAAAEAALFVIRTAFLTDAAAARFGFSTVPLARLAEAAAATLSQVRLRTPVVGLVGTPQSVEGVRLESGGSVAADGVVLAVPPQRLQRILGDSAAHGVPGLDAFRMQPIVDVHLWYAVEALGFDFAAILGSPVQWVFAKGLGYLCCSLSAASASVSLSEDELVDLADSEVRAVLPILRGTRRLRGAALRDPEATFTPSCGLRRPGPRTASPTLVLAGAWTDTGWPATMESAVRSGRAAARALLDHLSARAARSGAALPASRPDALAAEVA